MSSRLAGAALAFSLFAAPAFAQSPTTAAAPAATDTATQPTTGATTTASSAPTSSDAAPVVTGNTLGESGATPGTPGGINDQPAGASQHTPTENAAGKPVDLLSRLNPDLFGYVKLGYFFVTSPAEDTLIGSANGFRLVNARIGVSLHPAEKLEAVISIDGAAAQRRDTDPLEGSRVVSLKDGYLEYQFANFLKVRGGQYKAPFNAETLLPDDALPFISRSIVSDGILPPEGYAKQGLSLDRQVGIQAASDRLGGDIGFQYAVAVVNGNGQNVLNNDNNAVTPVARVTVSYKDLVTLGANGYYNIATIGPRPGRLNETRLAYGGDLNANLFGVNLFAMVLMQNVHHTDAGIPDESAMGIVASARYVYEPLGVEAGVRFDTYEPSSATANDQLSEVSAMVGYRVKNFPARILVQYTLRTEEPAAAVPNDSVDALAQVTF